MHMLVFITICIAIILLVLSLDSTECFQDNYVYSELRRGNAGLASEQNVVFSFADKVYGTLTEALQDYKQSESPVILGIARDRQRSGGTYKAILMFRRKPTPPSESIATFNHWISSQFDHVLVTDMNEVHSRIAMMG